MAAPDKNGTTDQQTAHPNTLIECMVISKLFDEENMKNHVLERKKSRRLAAAEAEGSTHDVISGTISRVQKLVDKFKMAPYTRELALALCHHATDRGVGYFLRYSVGNEFTMGVTEKTLPRACILIAAACASIANKYHHAANDFFQKLVDEVRLCIGLEDVNFQTVVNAEVCLLKSMDWRIQQCTMTGILECVKSVISKLSPDTVDHINPAIIRCYETNDQHAQDILGTSDGVRLCALACVQAAIVESLQSSFESQAHTPEASKPGSMLSKQKQTTCPWVHADTRAILLEASKALGIGDGVTKPPICEDDLYAKCVRIATAPVSPPCTPQVATASAPCSPQVGGKRKLASSMTLLTPESAKSETYTSSPEF